jgi:hypothetical protein
VTAIGPLLISLGMALMVWPLYERRSVLPENFCRTGSALRSSFKIRHRIPRGEMVLIDKLRKVD